MSLFGGPDYSHIIWRPQQFPQGESGIGGLMAGLGSGMQAGGDYKKAKGAWEEGGKKGPKPNAFKFFFGTAPEQQAESPSMQSPGGMFSGMQGRSGGSGSDMHGAIDALAEKLKAWLDQMGGR